MFLPFSASALVLGDVRIEVERELAEGWKQNFEVRVIDDHAVQSCWGGPLSLVGVC